MLTIAAIAACKHDDPARGTSSGSGRGSGGAQVARPPAPAAPTDRIPKLTAPIKLDGEWDEPDWSKTAFRRVFADAKGEQARPFSELRLLHDDHALYVGLYAADEHIQTGEFFELQLGPLALHADSTGKITPATPGVQAAIDRDGTLDNPKDDDEEWVLEIAIPLAATGLGSGAYQPVRAARCDTPKDGIERCGAWSGKLALD